MNTNAETLKNDTNEKTIVATFCPQAWMNDNAVTVDDEGENTWDVTAHITAMPRKEALDMQDHDEAAESLRDLPEAPEWIKNWDGPFNIKVTESIAEYFGIDNNNHEGNDDDNESST